jgi:MoaA/NifB/PqqE/SkfB family radical SAM enzyme
VALRFRRLGLKAMENAQHLGVPNLIRCLGGWTPFPMGVVLSLTMRCNLACQMCPQVQMREEAEYPELTLEQLEAVVDDLRASFPIRPLIHLIGGETLLRRDAITLARYIKARGFQCSLTTNGVLLQRHARELVELGLDRINVSVDGPREVHDAERGVRGAYDLAVSGVQALAAARSAAASSRPAITLNTVITGENLARLPEMIDIAKTAGADAVSYQHLIFSGCTAEGGATVPDLERLLVTIPLLRQASRAAGLPMTLFPRMGDSQLRAYYGGDERDLKPACVFPWYVIHVDTFGNITPCRGFVVDNVTTKSGTFAQVWNSARFRGYRKELARKGVFADCGRCCHRQY